MAASLTTDTRRLTTRQHLDRMHIPIILLLASAAVRVYSTPVCDACECTVLDTTQLINCSSRGLQHTFPDMAQWSEQTRSNSSKVAVSMDKNTIHRVDQFPLLPGIVRLSLAHNGILDIATHAFLKLDRLTHLDLSYNHLTGDSVRADVLRGSYRNEVYEPMELISLSLAYNDIHSLERRAFEHLPYLQELDLAGNPLRVIDVPTTASLAYPRALKVLDLSATGLSALSNEFVHLPSLKNHLEVLILSANNFTEVPGELGTLGSSLRELNLNGNPLLELSEGSLLGFRHLRKLSISGMPHLRSIGAGAFDELDNLTVLYAAHNPFLMDIDEDAFRQLRELHSLKEVHLEHCALDGLPEKLLPWKQLEILDIQSNLWLCDCDLQWMTKDLVPYIAAADPEHVVQLHCESPLWLSGIGLYTLSRQSDGGRGALCAPEPRGSQAARRFRPKSTGAILVLTAGACLICLAAIMTAFFCYRRFYVYKPVVFGTVVYVPVQEDNKY